MRRCFIFDIDGTIADISHRLPHIQQEPKNWREFFAACHADEPIRHVCEIVCRLAKTGAEIVFVTGRSDECREATVAWLRIRFGHSPSLYMRAAGDHRPEHIIKGELLDRLRADGYEPVMAFDDRDQAVRMWRERGIPCAQVAEGNF